MTRTYLYIILNYTSPQKVVWTMTVDDSPSMLFIARKFREYMLRDQT